MIPIPITQDGKQQLLCSNEIGTKIPHFHFDLEENISIKIQIEKILSNQISINYNDSSHFGHSFDLPDNYEQISFPWNDVVKRINKELWGDSG